VNEMLRGSQHRGRGGPSALERGGDRYAASNYDVLVVASAAEGNGATFNHLPLRRCISVAMRIE